MNTVPLKGATYETVSNARLTSLNGITGLAALWNLALNATAEVAAGAQALVLRLYFALAVSVQSHSALLEVIFGALAGNTPTFTKQMKPEVQNEDVIIALSEDPASFDDSGDEVTQPLATLLVSQTRNSFQIHVRLAFNRLQLMTVSHIQPVCGMQTNCSSHSESIACDARVNRIDFLN